MGSKIMPYVHNENIFTKKGKLKYANMKTNEFK